MVYKYYAKIKTLSVAIFMIFILIGVNDSWATSVDVTNLSYSDDSGRSIHYDFSGGTVSDNAIQLPETAITRGTGETGTAYLWGYVPGMPAINLSLDTTGKKATISSADEGECAAVLVTNPSVPPQTDTATWTYSLQLSNFNIDTTVDRAYLFDIGLGRDDETGEPYNEAFVSVKWVKGVFDEEFYDAWTLIIESGVETIDSQHYFSSIPLYGLTPSATTIDLHLEVDSNKHFSATASVNGGSTLLLGDGYTLSTAQGNFERLPGLFPFLFLEEESTSTEPQSQVYSIHWQRDGGPYEVGFEVRDPLHSASAVRVTNSSYLNDGIDLIWDDNNKCWFSSQLYRLGYSPVTPFPAFTFSFTPQTGGAAIADQTKSVTGYVDGFATNILPSGDVSSNPVFSWTGISGASGYGVELHAESGSAWTVYGIPPNATNTYSIPYTGPALTNGVTYGYNITTQVEHDGVWNSSITEGSFTYTGSGDGGETGTGIHPEATDIQSRFETAMASYNAGDFSEETGFASFISDNFLDYGENKTVFLAEAQEDYDESAPMTWIIDSILGTEDNAIINLTWGDGQKDVLYFRKEDSQWMLYGNQYLFDFWAQSGHQMYSDNSHPYWVSLNVQDRDGFTISSVNVTGPGLAAEGIELYHDQQSGLWHSWSSEPWSDDLSPKWASQPTVPMDYIFTINYSEAGGTPSSTTPTHSVNSFVNVAPSEASISPAADSIASRPVVFSWDSAGTGYRYRVEVSDANFNRIWETDDMTGTSTTYDGPELGGGQYYFNLITEDEYEDMSMVTTAFHLPLKYPRVALTSGAGTDNHPAWSPDGSKLAFTSDRSGTDNIWVINRDGSGLKQLTTFTGYQSASYPSFSPDGAKISFIMNDTDPALTIWEKAYFLYTMNSDGTSQAILSLLTETDQDPANQFWEYLIKFTQWLYNDHIMFVSFGPDGGLLKFYKYTISSEDVVQVVPEEENDLGDIYKISWNAVLSKLAFDRWPIGIQTMTDTGENYEVLDVPRAGQMDTPAQPGWRPDGSKIAFVKNFYEISDIAVFDLASGTVFVENTATDDEWPVWSPDGEAIAFVSNGKIFLMSLNQVLKGDLNNDDKVDLNDMALFLKTLTGLDTTGIQPYYSTSGADVNDDGKVGFPEALYILQDVSGLRD
jgi:hypothetical protein